MIQAGLEFDFSERNSVVKALLSLPKEMRPTHESDNEEGEKRKISDVDVFFNNLKNRKTGFFLSNEEILYDVEISKRSFFKLNCFFYKEYSKVENFMNFIMESNPNFGYACLHEERETKNKVKLQLNSNIVEAWIGRNIDKYIPGLYWITIISEFLAIKHEIDIEFLKQISVWHKSKELKLYIFCFHKNPSEWNSCENVKKAYFLFERLFHIEKVKYELSAAKNFIELSAVARKWD